ncbi:MAG: alpha/beta hydrolase family protein [Gemmataceae bacterium]
MLASLVLLFAADPVSPRQATLDVQDHIESKLPKLPTFDTPQAWQKYAGKVRADVLDKVVFRGEAAKWRSLGSKTVFGPSMPAEGCTVQKLRYEILPEMWIPALLYTPTKPGPKMPVMLAVNGHEAAGKAVDYKQIRCLNLARRGFIVLNVEWFGMGQLRQPGNNHGALNQIDLCGSSGLAPFYLSMSRGIDLLLSRPGADPARVAVSGLSGGGWQTITISSLDTRVALANPVAGYSAFKVKVRDHLMDLGDSEQTPCDLGTFADYTHLTCLRAPRPTLLTYNDKDRCCFTAGHALPPLLDAARPVFKLTGKPDNLRSHVNSDPGTHNYGKDNRQALYRAVGDYFFPGDKSFSADEIDVTADVKKAEELEVEVPADSLTLNTLALKLAKDLPRGAATRAKLRDVLRLPELTVTKAGEGSVRLSDKWTVPVRLTETAGATKTALVLNDAGFAADKVTAKRLAGQGYRVVEMDPWYFGASKTTSHDYLFALLLGCVGDRPLGIQAAQVNAVAAWAKGGVHVVAVGPRTSLIALAASAADDKAVGSVELLGGRATLKEVLEENRVMQQVPETFCFGLLEVADIKQLVELTGPRPVTFVDPGERHGKELAGVKNYRAAKGAK